MMFKFDDETEAAAQAAYESIRSGEPAGSGGPTWAFAPFDLKARWLNAVHAAIEVYERERPMSVSVLFAPIIFVLQIVILVLVLRR